MCVTSTKFPLDVMVRKVTCYLATSTIYDITATADTFLT